MSFTIFLLLSFSIVGKCLLLAIALIGSKVLCFEDREQINWKQEVEAILVKSEMTK